MNHRHYSLKEVAKIVGVKAHRIEYALRNGYLKEPDERVSNRRVFSPTDLQAAMIYFARPAALGRPARRDGDQ